MFKQSRRKIVAAILSVLVLLLFGTFCTIYLASYADMTSENREMLEIFVEAYSLPGEPGADPGAFAAGRPRDPRGKPPLLELSTFYSVALDRDGQVLKVDTADISTLSEESLTELARRIVESGREQGVENNLTYRMADKGDYTLVAFLDNTAMRESASTLIEYTLIFGGAALVLLFFLSRYLANRIVAPLEESYRRQKQFISDAGHEMKTPVAVVNANLELLSREIGETPWLANIQYETERMSALILQLLDLARAENIAPPMEVLDLSRLVYGETLPLETVAYENGLEFTSAVEEGLFVNGNSVQLKQLTSHPHRQRDPAQRAQVRRRPLAPQGAEPRRALGRERGAAHPGRGPEADLRALLPHGLGPHRRGAELRPGPRHRKGRRPDPQGQHRRALLRRQGGVLRPPADRKNSIKPRGNLQSSFHLPPVQCES